MMFLFMLLFGFLNDSKANDITVVDVRRNITLSEDDKVYKDFYINAGPASGLKKNLVVTAVRKLNIRDASGANAVGEILVPVGQLKVIAVYDKVAVAREYALLSRDEIPMLEQVGIMNGDRIDLKGSFIDISKPKPTKLKTTAQEAPSISVVSVASTIPVAPAVPITSPASPVAAPTAKAPASPVVSKDSGETLEKTADSGNNSVHE